MFLGTNALNADNNLTDSLPHNPDKKENCRQLLRACLYTMPVCRCANPKHVLSSHGIKAYKLFDLM